MKKLSVNMGDGTKMEVLLEDDATSSAVFSIINSGQIFKAKTMDGEEAEVFVHGAKFCGFVLSDYVAPISQEVMLEAMSEYEKTVQVAENFFKFEGNDGTPTDYSPFNESDVITIVH